MRSFAGRWPGRTLAIWCASLSKARQDLGWRVPHLGEMAEATLSGSDEDAEAEIKRIVATHPGAIHLYSGWKGNARGFMAFKAARADPDARHVVVAEPFRGWGLRRYARHARALLKTLPYRGHLDAILAMGEAGVSFYRSLGFGPGILFPFIYQSPSETAAPPNPCSGPMRLVYVGKFDARKGLQDLLRGLGRLTDMQWTLNVIGEGARRHELERLGGALGITERVHWKGVMRHDDLVEHLPSYDVAIVPSRFDGWGAVTNEALQAGLAVLVSDRASSNDLVRFSGAGLVFHAGDPRAIGDSLREMIANPDAVGAMKVRAAEYRERIGGDRVAKYLAEVLTAVLARAQNSHPVPPWVGTKI